MLLILFYISNSLYLEQKVDGGAMPTAKLTDIKATKKLASDITESGAKLYDLLQREKELRKARIKALQFLDGT